MKNKLIWIDIKLTGLWFEPWIFEQFNHFPSKSTVQGNETDKGRKQVLGRKLNQAILPCHLR